MSFATNNDNDNDNNNNNDDDDTRKKEQLKFQQKCETHVEKALSRNPTVKFLLEKLVALGCDPPPGFIRCMDCGTKRAGGGFGMVQETRIVSSNATTAKETAAAAAAAAAAATNTTKMTTKKPQCQQSVRDLAHQLQQEREGTVTLTLLPEIYLCQQHLRNERHAHESIVHELIHAIDMCRTTMDPLHNCIHMACTEVRAENLSGECNNLLHEFPKMQQYANHGQACVKRRAVLSVKANPNCKESAHDFVDAAFERCYQDTYPFDRHPNLA